MAYQTTHMLFRSLDDSEVEAFREYARKNDPPTTANGWVLTHPVCRAEWRKIGKATDPISQVLTSEETAAGEA